MPELPCFGRTDAFISTLGTTDQKAAQATLHYLLEQAATGHIGNRKNTLKHRAIGRA